MSFEALKWVGKIRDITTTERSVLYKLADHANADQNHSWSLKYQTIADDIGISRRTVIRCCNNLREKGYLIIVKQKQDNGGYRSNKYVIPVTRVVTQMSPGECHECHQGSDTDVTSLSGNISGKLPEKLSPKFSPEENSGEKNEQREKKEQEKKMSNVDDILKGHEEKVPKKPEEVYARYSMKQGRWTAETVRKIWRDLMSIHHPGFIAEHDMRDMGNFSTLAKRLPKQTLPQDINRVIQFWPMFSEFCKTNAGHLLPAKPSIRKLLPVSDHILNFKASGTDWTFERKNPKIGVISSDKPKTETAETVKTVEDQPATLEEMQALIAKYDL